MVCIRTSLEYHIVAYPRGVIERAVVLVFWDPGELSETGLRILFFRSIHSSLIPPSALALGEI